MELFSTHDQVTLGDVGHDIHNERYKLARGAGDDSVTRAILENLTLVKYITAGIPLEALRAFIHDDNMPDATLTEICETVAADYMTENLRDQASFDQDMSGIQEHVAEWADRAPEDDVDVIALDAYRDLHTGEIDLGRADLADRIESLENETYPVTDHISGRTFYFRSI